MYTVYWGRWPVASLGLVSPGRQLMGVTLFFFKKSDDLFSHRLWKWWPFWLHSHLLTSFIQCLSTFSHKKINFRSGVTPWRVSPGAVRPPPSNVTDWHWSVACYRPVYGIFATQLCRDWLTDDFRFSHGGSGQVWHWELSLLYANVYFSHFPVNQDVKLYVIMLFIL